MAVDEREGTSRIRGDLGVKIQKERREPYVSTRDSEKVSSRIKGSLMVQGKEEREYRERSGIEITEVNTNRIKGTLGKAKYIPEKELNDGVLVSDIETPESKKSVSIHSESSDVIYSKEKNVYSNIYILDFLIRMMQPSNIPTLIYLILNMLFIGGIVTLVFSVPVIWGMCCGIIIYAASVCISLSPIGEAMLRHQSGWIKIRDRETVDYIKPIFDEVYEKARKRNPEISKDVRLFLSEEKASNAFATGRKTICVTSGLLEQDEEIIKGALAHEFGHLAHRDTDRILVVAVGNTIISGISMAFQLVVYVIHAIMIMGALFRDDEDSILMIVLSFVMKFITLFIIHSILKLWFNFGLILCMKTDRMYEFKADEYAVALGYGEGIYAAVATLEDDYPAGLFASLVKSHPDTADRLDRIEKIGIRYEMK